MVIFLIKNIQPGRKIIKMIKMKKHTCPERSYTKRGDLVYRGRKVQNENTTSSLLLISLP